MYQASTKDMVSIAYENQLLGAFIYALGYEGGRQGRTLPVNLFQQTPLDRSLGDVVLGAQRCMAIEFKRRQADIRGERKKWKPGFPEALMDISDWRHTSLLGHFICFGEHAATRVDLHFAQYLSAFELDGKADSFSASDLIKLLTRELSPGKEPSWGVPPQVLLTYLEHIRTFRVNDSDGSGGHAATWLTVSAADGQFQLLAAPSLDALLERDATTHANEQGPSAQEADDEHDTPSPGF